MGNSDAELAKTRLATLLDYCDEVQKLNSTKPGTSNHPLVLPPWGIEERLDTAGGEFVLHEDVLQKLLDVKESGSSCCTLGGRRGGNGDSDAGDVWLRLHRPDSTEARDAASGKLLCTVYAALYSAHQEALREGRGAQLTAGVGILRWRRHDGQIVDHPLITLPAELELDSSGEHLPSTAHDLCATCDCQNVSAIVSYDPAPLTPRVWHRRSSRAHGPGAPCKASIRGLHGIC